MRGPTVLVTGATGFLGGRLVEELTRRDFDVRALARRSSNTVKLQSAGAEILFGDIRDIDSLKKAMEKAEVVVHAAADTSGHEGQGGVTTVVGTKNTLDAAMDAGVRQFVYLSSCSVYGVADCKAGQKIDESGPLERFPEARGDYSNAKFEAEKCVLKAMKNGVMNITCLRPGTIWGPGGETFTPIMGFFLGKRIACIIGSRKFVLPLVYIDNMVNAIITCMDHPHAYNEVFNVVDPQTIDKQTYVNEVLKPLFPGVYFIRLPYWALYSAVGCQEILCRAIGRKPFLTRYRLISSQRPVVYDAGKITRETGWRAPVGFKEAVRKVLTFENSKLL